MASVPVHSLIFSLQGRQAFVDLYLAADSPYQLFLSGSCANAYGEIDGRRTWVHGTFGEDYLGIDGKYYEVSIDRAKALRTEFPRIEIVGQPRLFASAEALACSRSWVRNGAGRVALFTYCNFNVSFCRSMVYKRPGLQYGCWSEPEAREWTANEIWRELVFASDPHRPVQTWVRLDHVAAQHIANLGGFVVASSYNPNGSGHIVFLTEDTEHCSKDYDQSTDTGRRNCAGLKCFHCGSGTPRLTMLDRVFSALQASDGASPSGAALDSVRLYCDRETWGEYTRWFV